MSARNAITSKGPVKQWRSFGAVLVVCAGLALLPSCNSSADRTTSAHSIERRPDALVSALHDSLRARNARITTLQILAVESIPWSTSHLALVARGVAPGEFSGRFADEMFGVFLIDSTLTQVTRTVDAFPTRRWHDYAVRFERAGLDSLYVVGAGVAHGDEAIRRAYNWDAVAR